MAYTSPNAPSVWDVLETWLLSILDGQRCYTHVTGLRGDAVVPQILGMKKIVSDESLRRALAHLAPTVAPVVRKRSGPGVKLLYGHQDGTEVGYNPSKPERPSHTIHTYWIANLRLVLDAEI